MLDHARSLDRSQKLPLTNNLPTYEGEVRGEWKRLHREELYNVNPSPNIVRANKSRTMRWVGHVTHKEERRGAYRNLGGGSPE